MMAFVLVFAVLFGAEAQNRSIEFEQTKDLETDFKESEEGEEADFCGLLHLLVRSLQDVVFPGVHTGCGGGFLQCQFCKCQI